MRERERERDAEQGDRVTVLRTAALMILKLENPLESLEDRIAIHMNRFLRTSLVFSSSSLRVNPISLSYPFPLPLTLSFARSRECKGYPNSRFDQGVGLRASGRYPLKPRIFTSLLETKGYPENTAQPATMAARSPREFHKCKYFRLK